MSIREMQDVLERSPIIAAVHDNQWQNALNSSAEVIFLLKANLLTIRQQLEQAKALGKYVFVHIDLAEGIGKDEIGLAYLARCGCCGIISTRGGLIRHAKDLGLLTVQRFFVLDSQGIQSIFNVLETSRPDFIEILPGIADKVIKRFASCGFPMIAGGLIETKQEVTNALSCGAMAVSTGAEELWNLA